MKEVPKPPIGVMPYYMVAQNRVLSLAQAITRYALISDMDADKIKKWAEEIVAQCELMEKLRD